MTRQVFEELDFAIETRSFVLIEGREGIGKTEAARNWCDQHPGQAIYVRLEAGVGETTLDRSVARRIGTACSYRRKAIEMRAQIQDAMQAGHLALVLDEAHFLWPQSGRSERSAPKRMDWVRIALVDFDVPVALISTPPVFRSLMRAAPQIRMECKPSPAPAGADSIVARNSERGGCFGGREVLLPRNPFPPP